MNLFKRIDTLARAANTHFVANAGLVVAGAAGVLHIAADVFARNAIHIPLAASIAISDVDDLTFPLLTGGAIAAYFGRPKTVPADPEPPKPIEPKPKPKADVIELVRDSVLSVAQHEAKHFSGSAAIGKGSTIITGRSDSPPAPSAHSGGSIAPASPVALDVARPTPFFSASLPHVAGTAGGSSHKMTIFQDLGIAEAIFADLTAFEGGKTVSDTVKIGGKSLAVSAVKLGAAPVAPYEVVAVAPIMAIFSEVLEDYGSFESGNPISIAVKFNTTWYGVSVALAPATAAPAPVAAA